MESPPCVSPLSVSGKHRHVGKVTRLDPPTSIHVDTSLRHSHRFNLMSVNVVYKVHFLLVGHSSLSASQLFDPLFRLAFRRHSALLSWLSTTHAHTPTRSFASFPLRSRSLTPSIHYCTGPAPVHAAHVCCTAAQGSKTTRTTIPDLFLETVRYQHRHRKAGVRHYPFATSNRRVSQFLSHPCSHSLITQTSFFFPQGII